MFFFKQKTAYEMRISDWSSDVCSSDLVAAAARALGVKATIVMPFDAPALKIANTRAYGARIVHYDRLKDDREAIARTQIGRASCRERVCQYVKLSVVAVSLKKKSMSHSHTTTNQTAHYRITC